MSEIIDDQRPIRAITYDDAEGTVFAREQGYRVEAYGEEGMHCMLPWFRVSKDGHVVARVPATHVTVVYEESHD